MHKLETGCVARTYSYSGSTLFFARPPQTSSEQKVIIDQTPNSGHSEMLLLKDRRQNPHDRAAEEMQTGDQSWGKKKNKKKKSLYPLSITPPLQIKKLN